MEEFVEVEQEIVSPSKEVERVKGRFQPGPNPDRGRGVAPGHPLGGAPKESFRAAMRELVSTDAVIEHVRRVLNDPKHPHWMRAFEFAVERGYGKEATEQVQSGETTLNVVIRQE